MKFFFFFQKQFFFKFKLRIKILRILQIPEALLLFHHKSWRTGISFEFFILILYTVCFRPDISLPAHLFMYYVCKCNRSMYFFANVTSTINVFRKKISIINTQREFFSSLPRLSFARAESLLTRYPVNTQEILVIWNLCWIVDTAVEYLGISDYP